MIKESIFDPISKTLSTEVFRNNQINPTIRTQIIGNFQNWLSKFNLQNTVKSMSILGSITGFQYTPNSDIDVNVVLDIPEDKLKELVKTLPNNINASGTQHPINYYISPIFKPEWTKETNGIYDLLNNKWIKEPQQPKTLPEQNLRYASELSRFFTSGLDTSISEFYRDLDVYENTTDKLLKQQKLNELKDDILSIKIAKHIIHQFRTEAYTDKPFPVSINVTSANESINNLIYKYIERLGYFEKIDSILKIADKMITG